MWPAASSGLRGAVAADEAHDPNTADATNNLAGLIPTSHNAAQIAPRGTENPTRALAIRGQNIAFFLEVEPAELLSTRSQRVRLGGTRWAGLATRLFRPLKV